MGTEPNLTHHLLTQFDEARSNQPSQKIHCLLAYSGGLDSHVLLHALAQLAKEHPAQFSLRAVHVNHGLQDDANNWAKHCEHTCSELNIPLTVKNLNLSIPQGASLEAAARDSRYQVFKNTLQNSEYLVTAHHQNDQAETLLIQLFRGSGAQGLAAMPRLKTLANGYLFRPLLNISRAELANYAQIHQLQYIDDPSNIDARFDRNFIRHSVLPKLRDRWPSITTTLSRASRLQAENQQLLEEYLQSDYRQICNENNAIALDNLQTFSLPRQKALIRYWLKQQNYLMPSEIKLNQIIDTVVPAKADAMPCVSWGDIEVRRFRNHLYAVPSTQPFDTRNTYQWDGKADFVIPETKQTLKAECLAKGHSLLHERGKHFTILFRQEGERVTLPKHAQTHSLKKLMQTLNIPPWERGHTPLIFLNGQLICIYGYQTYETD
jgi:tRNA(Ile)-lysidine synthase